MHEGGWVVLRTQPRYEFLAARAAAARGLETYAPVVLERPADRSSILFPGYLFARVGVATEDLVRIRSLPGVAYTLPRGEHAMLLSDGVVDLIRKRLSDPAPTALRALWTGYRGPAINGPFRWMEAVFDRRLNAAGRIRILFELAHRTLQLKVEKPDPEVRKPGLFRVWRGETPRPPDSRS